MTPTSLAILIDTLAELDAMGQGESPAAKALRHYLKGASNA